MPATAIPPDLIAAYNRTDYTVRPAPPHDPFTFHIGRHSPPLARLMAQTGARTAAFITAWNPFSRPRPTPENQAGLDALRAEALILSPLVIDALGADPAGGWPPEPSLLVLNLTLIQARALARRYQQNALVWSTRSARPRLVLMR